MKQIIPALLILTAAFTAQADRLPRQDADYVVPVTDQALAPFAGFETKIKWINTTPGERAYRYELPFELDGLGQDIELAEGADGIFRGAKIANTLCDTVAGVFSCKICYQNLTFDREAAISAINRRFANPLELSARLQLQASFASDPEPCGVLTPKGDIEY